MTKCQCQCQVVELINVWTPDQAITDWTTDGQYPHRLSLDAVTVQVMRQARLTYYHQNDPLIEITQRFVDAIVDGPLLVVLGNVGRGKTYLGGLIARLVVLKTHQPERLYQVPISPDMIRWPAFLEQWKSSESWNDFVRVELAAVKRSDLLIIDELGREGRMTDQERSSFEMIIDERYTMRKPTILLSNMPRRKFEQYMEPAMMSRLHDWSSRWPDLGIRVLSGPDRREPM